MFLCAFVVKVMSAYKYNIHKMNNSYRNKNHSSTLN